MFRELLSGQTDLIEEPPDLREIDALPWPGHNKRTRAFARCSVWHRDDRNLGHSRVRVQQVFHFLRTDVLAGANDDVLLAAAHHEIVVVDDSAKIAHAEETFFVEYFLVV